MSDITLTKSISQNLSSLKATQTLMDSTSYRLTTGKKVNTALDDPINFFAAQDNTSKSSDLGVLKDGMGEGIETINAASTGIDSISDLIDTAKSLAKSALTAEDADEAQTYIDQYNAILDEIDATAEDSVYSGINLLGSDTLDIAIGSSASDKISVAGIDASASGLSLSAVADGAWWTAAVSASAATPESTSVTGSASFDLSLLGSGSSDDVTVTIKDSDGNTVRTETITGASVGSTAYTWDGKDDNGDYVDDGNYTISYTNADTTNFSVAATASSDTTLTVDYTAAADAVEASDAKVNSSAINAALTQLDTAKTTLRAASKTLSSQLSIVTNREDFTSGMIDILEEGAANLVNADTTEEGVNLTTLETQQSLGIQALSIATSASQAVLNLFG